MPIEISNIARHALAIATGAAVLAACSNNGGPSLAPPAPTRVAIFGHLGRAAMVNGPLVAAARLNLRLRRNVLGSICPAHINMPEQYISDFAESDVLQFDYPNCISSIGSITGVSEPQGECTRNGSRTFWVTASGSDEIEEFNLGGKSAIKTLSESVGTPAGCAIDPATGDLAATIVANGDVILYKNARGKYKSYKTSLIEAFFGGYDNRGNLFVDGFNSRDASGLVELKKGSNTFETIATSNSVEFPGGVQFDGKYVTVNDQAAHAIYRYAVSGTTATLEGTVSLSGSSDCVQTSITTALVYCPDAGNVDVEVYEYPAGGSPVATLAGSFSEPIGSVKLVK